MLTHTSRTLAMMLATCLLGLNTLALQAEDKAAARLGVGDASRDFELEAVAGARTGKVKLSEVLKDGPVVLAVLRGFPGSQCPACSAQVGSLIGKARQFANVKTHVLLVYPGPALELNLRADEFLQGTKLPANFTMLLDPGYEFTNAYGLRWNAPNETAYPSTYVIDSNGKVRFAKTSMTHKGRATGEEVLDAVLELAQ